MSLPHFSEESGSSYFLRKQHRKGVEAGYLFTSTHNRVLFVFCATGKLLVLVDSEDRNGFCRRRRQTNKHKHQRS